MDTGGRGSKDGLGDMDTGGRGSKEVSRRHGYRREGTGLRYRL